MARLRGADEVVVGAVEHVFHLPEHGGVAVGQRLHGDAFLVGRLLHLEAVLVGAGQMKNVAAVEALEARDRVGRQRRVGVADVRHAVGIENRRRDVEFLARGHVKPL